jgi:hypothetical protein
LADIIAKVDHQTHSPGRCRSFEFHALVVGSVLRDHRSFTPIAGPKPIVQTDAEGAEQGIQRLLPWETTFSIRECRTSGLGEGWQFVQFDPSENEGAKAMEVIGIDRPLHIVLERAVPPTWDQIALGGSVAWQIRGKRTKPGHPCNAGQTPASLIVADDLVADEASESANRSRTLKIFFQQYRPKASIIIGLLRVHIAVDWNQD